MKHFVALLKMAEGRSMGDRVGVELHLAKDLK